jgi:hypothetical protein
MEEMAKRRWSKIYSINMPMVIHSVITSDGEEVLFDEGGGLYNLQTETISGLSENGDSISLKLPRISQFQIIDESSGRPRLREIEAASFTDYIGDCPKGRFGDISTPICNTINVESWGIYDHEKGFARGVTREGVSVQKELKDIYSVGVKETTIGSVLSGGIIILALTLIALYILLSSADWDLGESN